MIHSEVLPASTLKKIIREKPVFLLICITILYFYRPIFLGEVFYFRDLYAHFVPIKKLTAEIISSHELPLWDPYLQGGSPLLANPNNMVLYPTNLLYLWLPAHRVLTFEIVFHLLLGMLSVYVFSRLIVLDQISSFIAAIIYGFSGYAFSTLNFLNWLTASAYLPVIFCFWRLFLTSQQKKWWICCIAAASLQVFAGVPEITLITFATLIFWTLFNRHEVSASQKIVQWLILGLFTAAVCSILILPAIELSRVSIRGFGFGYETSTAWSIHPYRFAEFIFPQILGRFTSTAAGDYWGQTLEGTNSYFLSIYFGITAWIFAMIAGFSSQEHECFSPSLRRACIILIMLLLIFSAARYLPGVQKLFALLALRVPFRYPVKLLAAVIFPFSLLAGYGSRLILNHYRKADMIFWGISGFLILLLLAFYFSLSLNGAVANSIFAQSLTQQMRATWIHAIFHSFAMWTVICLVRQTAFRWKHACVAAVVALDLLLAGIPYKIFGSAELYTQEPQIADAIKKAIDSGKLFRIALTKEHQSEPPDEDIYWRVLFQQQILSGHLASNFGIPVIFHDDQDGSSLLSINYLRLVIGNLPWPRKVPLLSAANVRLILTQEQLSVPGLQHLQTFDGISPQPFYLYSNEKTAGSPQFVNQWIHARNGPEMLRHMTESDFWENGGIVLQTAMKAEDSRCSEAQILTKRHTNRDATYQIKSDCAGFLEFADPAYPGWRVKVDHVEAPFVPANLIYSAVFVEQGTHEIEKTYSPGSVTLGFIISILAVICMLLIPRDFIKW